MTYILLVGVPLAGLLFILHAGSPLSPVAHDVTPGSSTNLSAKNGVPGEPDLVLLIAQIAVIIAASSLTATLFRKIKQPKVIGEMFAGIILGPSLLGWVAPHLSAILFPAASLPYLNALSQIGVVLYMFLVGLALDARKIRKYGHAAVVASHASIIAPFIMGAALALLLYSRLAEATVEFSDFALFMGAAMSITAFPVLARILTQRQMLGTKLGSLAITCAAVDDVTGWCILAYIVLRVRSHGAASSIWITVSGLVAFLLVMLFIIKPLLRRFEIAFKAHGRLTESPLAALMLVVLLSALSTERLGLHLLFGSFFAGAMMPKDPKFVRHVTDTFENATVVLLLPLYFAFTGLRTSIPTIQGPGMWTICAILIVTAIAGKLGGSALAARFTGRGWRESVGLGILMNTRGLMELVILNIGLDIGVISRPVFSMMVVMALVTTFMTEPLLSWVWPSSLVLTEKADDPGLGMEPQTVR